MNRKPVPGKPPLAILAAHYTPVPQRGAPVSTVQNWSSALGYRSVMRCQNGQGRLSWNRLSVHPLLGRVSSRMLSNALRMRETVKTVEAALPPSFTQLKHIGVNLIWLKFPRAVHNNFCDLCVAHKRRDWPRRVPTRPGD